jgi:DNA modification methylase
MHPTVKPTALVADAIKDCTARGHIVLDAFVGSGTTIIAAEKTGRVCCALELDPCYVDVAIKRWDRLSSKKAVHAETGLSFDELAAARQAEPPRPAIRRMRERPIRGGSGHGA